MKYVTSIEAAKILGVSRGSIQHYKKIGKISPSAKQGRKELYLKKDIMKLNKPKRVKKTCKKSSMVHMLAEIVMNHEMSIENLTKAIWAIVIIAVITLSGIAVAIYGISEQLRNII
jgi:hypothetical protein